MDLSFNQFTLPQHLLKRHGLILIILVIFNSTTYSRASICSKTENLAEFLKVRRDVLDSPHPEFYMSKVFGQPKIRTWFFSFSGTGHKVIVERVYEINSELLMKTIQVERREGHPTGSIPLLWKGENSRGQPQAVPYKLISGSEIQRRVEFETAANTSGYEKLQELLAPGADGYSKAIDRRNFSEADKKILVGEIRNFSPYSTAITFLTRTPSPIVLGQNVLVKAPFGMRRVVRFPRSTPPEQRNNPSKGTDLNYRFGYFGNTVLRSGAANDPELTKLTDTYLAATQPDHPLNENRNIKYIPVVGPPYFLEVPQEDQDSMMTYYQFESDNFMTPMDLAWQKTSAKSIVHRLIASHKPDLTYELQSTDDHVDVVFWYSGMITEIAKTFVSKDTPHQKLVNKLTYIAMLIESSDPALTGPSRDNRVFVSLSPTPKLQENLGFETREEYSYVMYGRKVYFQIAYEPKAAAAFREHIEDGLKEGIFKNTPISEHEYRQMLLLLDTKQ